MSEPHTLWRDQCLAAATIENNWGTRQALDYLIAEKFLNFVREAMRHVEFADELPAFATAVKRLFPRTALEPYLADLERSPPRRADDDPVWAAEEILAIRKAATLLL